MEVAPSDALGIYETHSVVMALVLWMFQESGCNQQLLRQLYWDKGDPNILLARWRK